MSGFTLTIAIFLVANFQVGNSVDVANKSLSLPQQGKRFISTTLGFSVEVPSGWMVQEIDNTNTHALLDKIMQGSRLLAEFCPQEQPHPDGGREYSCQEFTQSIKLQRYPNLYSQPIFTSASSGSASDIDRLLAYHVSKLEGLGYTDISVVQNMTTLVNLVDVDGNTMNVLIPANIVELTYNNADLNRTRGFFLLSATNATSNTGVTSGYVLSYEAPATIQPSGATPLPIAQIFQSFEFVNQSTDYKLSRQQEDSDDYQGSSVVSNHRFPQYLDDILSPSGGPPADVILNGSNSTRNVIDGSRNSSISIEKEYSEQYSG